VLKATHRQKSMMRFTSLFHHLSLFHSALVIVLCSSLTVFGTPQISQALPSSLDFEFLDCQEGDTNLKIKMNRFSPSASSIYMDGFVPRATAPSSFGPNGFGFYGEFADWVETPEYISLPVPVTFGNDNRPEPIAATYAPRMGTNSTILDLRLYKQTGDRYKVVLVTSFGNTSGFSSKTLNSCQVKNLAFIKKVLPDQSKSAIVCAITVEALPAFTTLNPNWKNGNFATVQGDRKCQ
jgi:hypothetical protein